MSEIIDQSLETSVPSPFDAPAPDSVAAATGLFYAVESYVDAAERGAVPLDEGITLQNAQVACAIAEYRLKRTRMAAMPCTHEPAEDLKIKYLPGYASLVDAPTGAFAPIKLSENKEPSPEEVKQMIHEGEWIATIEAYQEWCYDTRAYAEDVTYDLNDEAVLRASLRFAFLTAKEDWQRLEAIWLADKHGFDDIAEELTARNWDRNVWTPQELVSDLVTTFSRAHRLMTSLSKLGLNNGIIL